ncbi:putative CvpA family protein [Aeromicrobium marinum DSM 15272]|uniref:CvpA family protein n=1 Tax=Aeromicrobium marinum DSM 15272 TaxID=585531 RepID=E2SC69_9ACTN|nr:MarP family serine protease [Aeromicrobium marinum]EFQ83355.1 putative CvpA family protein [Aeromicrobium marinum DSM 15272]
MNSLDVLIVVLLLAYAVSGYVQGFIANLAATLGLLVAGGLALAVVPLILSPDEPGLGTSLLALGIVVASAAAGQLMGSVIGGDLRRGIRTEPGRVVDAVGGSGLSIVAVLLASWALGYAVSGTQVPYLSQAARSSSILGYVDRVVPSQAADALNAFTDSIDSSIFPRYLAPFEAEDIVRVGPPDPATLQLPGVSGAAGSVVKIIGDAECNRGIEGSGFVYADDRVMTNAHVVAGVERPFVVTQDGRVPARVVVFDPELDVAVLAADLDLPALAFEPGGVAGQDAAVLGFPANGPFDAQPARIREEIRLRSLDIYDQGEVLRDSFSIRALVRSGNSGGPLVSADGTVLGVIFAASITDDSTGYALTAAAVADHADDGIRNQDPVSSGACA